MRNLIYILALAFVASCSESPKIQKVIDLHPEKVSPDIYKVLLDNEHVKVLEVTFAPGQSDSMHEHYAMTAYVIEGGKAQITLPDGTVSERDIPSGATMHNPTITKHQVKNIGNNTMKILLVEQKG
tara:strand:+ start:200 stop:577 length:378 start_codon:yes stop_codon:yes gene_type:complete